MSNKFGPIVPYTIKRSEFGLVKYMEQTLLRTSLWCDWIVLKSLMLSYRASVVNRTEVTAKRAEQMIWNAFAAAVNGDERSPVYFEFITALGCIPANIKPIFIGRVHIAIRVHQGMTVQEAEHAFLTWLEIEDNDEFGEYRLLPDFSTVPIGNGGS